MPVEVEVVVKAICPTIGEGPHWDERTQCLVYVDIDDGQIHRWNSQTGEDEMHKFDRSVSFIVPCRKGGYMIGLGQTISHFDWDTKKVTELHKVDQDKPKETRFNDGKCDPSGRLWCGTMGLETVPAHPKLHQGSLYSLELDGSLKKHKTEISISNGLAWTEDNKTMFYIDSVPRKVFAYDYDIKTGTMSNERVAVNFGGEETMPTFGFPDGMAIDTDGKIWVACYSAGRVIRFDPATGAELASVSLPAKRTTSCCFGGKNFDEMYVTCARYGMSEEEKANYPLAGSVFKVTGLGVRGKPAPVYEG